jgi:hypothetical protein
MEKYEPLLIALLWLIVPPLARVVLGVLERRMAKVLKG